MIRLMESIDNKKKFICIFLSVNDEGSNGYNKEQNTQEG